MRWWYQLAIVVAVVLAQFTWATHWVIGGICPNIILVALVVLTLRRGLRAGLIWATVAGFFAFILSPWPAGGLSLALFAAAAVCGFLAEYVFSTATPVSSLVQAVLATGVFGLVCLVGTTVIFLFQGMDTTQLWSVELWHTVGQMAYHLVLIFAAYLVVDQVTLWHEHVFRGVRFNRTLFS
jgi:hypothetical protein